LKSVCFHLYRIACLAMLLLLLLLCVPSAVLLLRTVSVLGAEGRLLLCPGLGHGGVQQFHALM
jgi:hypothetical protein